MKMFLFFALLFLPATALHAESFKDQHTVCAAFSMFAETAMKVRQEGKPLHKLTNGILESTENTKELNDILVKIVAAAYEFPRYSTIPYQQKAIQDFSNEIYINCMGDTLK